MREWLIDSGIWGVSALMFLQNILPLVPSEIIMPWAGFLASLGYLDIHGVFLAGLAGSVAGHLPWYYLGSALGERRLESFLARHGRFLLLPPAQVRKAEAWFERHGMKAVLLARLVPGLRTCVNIPAGAMRMGFLPYIACTLLGDALWTGLLGYGGFLLGRDYALIARYLHLALGPLAVLAAMFLVLRNLRRPARDRRTA
jgi:membrane protein DedA with SNARE-associated domain